MNDGLLGYPSTPRNHASSSKSTFSNGMTAHKPVFAFGIRRLISSYRGPIMRLKRVSDSAERDWTPTASGKLDLNAIKNWASVSLATDLTTEIELVKMYNQKTSVDGALCVMTTNVAITATFRSIGDEYFVYKPYGQYFEITNPPISLNQEWEEGRSIIITAGTGTRTTWWGFYSQYSHGSNHLSWSMEGGMSWTRTYNYSNYTSVRAGGHIDSVIGNLHTYGQNVWYEGGWDANYIRLEWHKDGSIANSGNKTGRIQVSNNAGWYGMHCEIRFRSLYHWSPNLTTAQHLEFSSRELDFFS